MGGARNMTKKTKQYIQYTSSTYEWGLLQHPQHSFLWLRVCVSVSLQGQLLLMCINQQWSVKTFLKTHNKLSHIAADAAVICLCLSFSFDSNINFGRGVLRGGTGIVPQYPSLVTGLCMFSWIGASGKVEVGAGKEATLT